MNSAANETASLPAIGRCRDCRGPVFRMSGTRAAWRCDPCAETAAVAKKVRREAAAADYAGRSPLIAAAHNAVARAVRRGELAPASSLPCSDRDAGERCGGRKALHHDDYRRPLDVRCLCAFHHAWWHWNNRPLNAGRPVKCSKRGCPARMMDGPRVWRCEEHAPKDGPPEWRKGRSGWRLEGHWGSALVTRCSEGCKVKLWHHEGSEVRVHTPEDLRAEMRRVYTLVTGMEVA